jgi:hypothetical protein
MRGSGCVSAAPVTNSHNSAWRGMETGVHRFLADDHDRLEALLERATAVPGMIDSGSYDAFRRGLLRHIAMEEKVLFPAIAGRSVEGAETVKRLRLDHGAIAALLVPPPNEAIIATLRSSLEVHNAREEEEGGVYGMPEAGEERALVERINATPEVPAAPYNERPGVLAATRRAVERAGYRFLEIR